MIVLENKNKNLSDEFERFFISLNRKQLLSVIGKQVGLLSIEGSNF